MNLVQQRKESFFIQISCSEIISGFFLTKLKLIEYGILKNIINSKKINKIDW